MSPQPESLLKQSQHVSNQSQHVSNQPQPVLVEANTEAPLEPQQTIPTKVNSQTDLYQILEIQRDADLAKIKEKYLQLALIYHPDKPQGDLQKFKDVCLAYKVLSSKKRRKEYDLTLASTVDELRDKDNRDVEYHHSDKFTKVTEEGKEKFDEEEFNSSFNEGRTQEDRVEMNALAKESKQREVDFKENKGKTLEELMADRERDIDTVQQSVTNVISPNNFDASVFNQMFNDMKSRKKELELVDDQDEQGEPSGLFAGGGVGGFGGAGGAGGGFGGAGGVDGTGSLSDQMTFKYNSTPFGGSTSGQDRQTMFEQPVPDIMQKIKERSAEYVPNPEIMHVKDQLHTDEAKKSFYQGIEDRLAELEKDREDLLNMDKSEYIVKPEMITNPLGDSELFQDEVLTLDAVKQDAVKKAVSDDESDDESSDDESSDDESDDE